MKGIVRAAFISAVVALAGCGGGSSNPAGQFAGTWKYGSGMFLTTYMDGSTDPEAVTGNLTLSRGVAADLLYATATNGPACNFMMDAQGNIATILPGSSCTETFTASSGYPATVTFAPTSWTLQLNGTILNESGSGTCQAISQGLTYTCTFTESATLTKIGI